MSSLYTIQLNQSVKLGPMALSQLEEMIRQGRMQPSTPVFTHDSNRWHLAATLPEIRELLDKYQLNYRQITHSKTSSETAETEEPLKTHEDIAVGKTPAAEEKQVNDKVELYTIRANDGMEYGPIKLSEIKKLVKQDKIKATTMVFRRSTNRWHLAASIPEIRTFLRRYKPTEDDILNRIRALTSSSSRDSAHTVPGAERASTVQLKRPFWKKFFPS